MTIEEHTEAMFYRKSSRPFLRIALEAHDKMKRVLDALEKMASAQQSCGDDVLPLRWPPGSGEGWETNVSAQMRFFAEREISGGSWVQVPAQRASAQHAKKTPCALEFECAFDEVLSLTHDITDTIFHEKSARKAPSLLDDAV